MDREVARQLDAGDGARIAYRVLRARSRTPAGVVVLLHGLASNLTRWSKFVEATALAERWDLIRVDLRGQGNSMTRRPIGLDLWRDDLAAIVAAESHARAVLVGHSLGAQLAMHAAATRPESVQAVALIDPVFGAFSSSYWSSTSIDVNPAGAWVVSFNAGAIIGGAKENDHAILDGRPNVVRAVRRGR